MAPKYEACKECQLRSIGCHSHCAAYLAFREAADKEREERLKKIEENDNHIAVRFGRTYSIYRNNERK